MSCLPKVFPEPPPLPFPISITPPAPPPIPLPPELCCHLINLAIVVPPIPFPPLIMSAPGLSAAISQFLKTITDYIDALPLHCPKE